MMSAADIFSRRSQGRVSPLANLVGDITQRVERYKTYRRTLDELETLSDRELSDLGLSRTMLRAIAYKAAYDG